MTRAVLVLVASVLLLGTPAWGQTVDEIEKLIADLGDGRGDARFAAAGALGELGPQAASAVPALAAALSDDRDDVRVLVVWALGWPSLLLSCFSEPRLQDEEQRDERGGSAMALSAARYQCGVALTEIRASAAALRTPSCAKTQPTENSAPFAA